MADQLFGSIATLLNASIDFYHSQQMKEKRRKLEALKQKWDLPRGTMLTLKIGTYLRDYHVSDLTPKWFDAGYAPMLLSVHWPKLAESASEVQSPIVFHFWCSGITYVYSWRADNWGNDLPFKVLDESV